MPKKCEKCGTCSKVAADDSVQCEICEQWFHNKCQDISDLLYKALHQFGSEIHWYCKTCRSGAEKLLNAIAKIQNKVDRLEEELSRIKHDTKQDVSMQLAKFEERLGACDDKVAAQIKDMRDHVEHIVHDYKLVDAKIESLIDSKMIESVEQVEAKHMQELEVMKSSIKEKDQEIDAVIKVKLLENNEEEKEKALRKNNVILFGVQENDDDDGSKRLEHDKEIINEVMNTLMIEETKVKTFFRLGKPASNEDSVAEKKHRPLKVVLEDEKSKNELLRTAKYLRDTKFRKIFIAPDQTQKEREAIKILLRERNERRALGEDLVIYQGTLVKRRVKDPSGGIF